MNWISKNGAWISGGYTIYTGERDCSIWFKTADSYGLLARRFDTVAQAKLFCQEHAAKLAAHQEIQT